MKLETMVAKTTRLTEDGIVVELANGAAIAYEALARTYEQLETDGDGLPVNVRETTGKQIVYRVLSAKKDTDRNRQVGALDLLADKTADFSGEMEVALSETTTATQEKHAGLEQQIAGCYHELVAPLDLKQSGFIDWLKNPDIEGMKEGAGVFAYFGFHTLIWPIQAPYMIIGGMLGLVDDHDRSGFYKLLAPFMWPLALGAALKELVSPSPNQNVQWKVGNKKAITRERNASYAAITHPYDARADVNRFSTLSLVFADGLQMSESRGEVFAYVENRNKSDYRMAQWFVPVSGEQKETLDAAVRAKADLYQASNGEFLRSLDKANQLAMLKKVGFL